MSQLVPGTLTSRKPSEKLASAWLRSLLTAVQLSRQSLSRGRDTSLSPLSLGWHLDRGQRGIHHRHLTCSPLAEDSSQQHSGKRQQLKLHMLSMRRMDFLLQSTIQSKLMVGRNLLNAVMQCDELAARKHCTLSINLDNRPYRLQKMEMAAGITQAVSRRFCSTSCSNIHKHHWSSRAHSCTALLKPAGLACRAACMPV